MSVERYDSGLARRFFGASISANFPLLRSKIEHLESVMPHLLNRPTSSIQFEIDIGVKDRLGEYKGNWVVVSDTIWYDLIIDGKPDAF
jgi:hypothetical protein